MKRKFKKLLALSLALAMVGSSVALAGDNTMSGGTEGGGEMEGFVGAEADVFSVELPTDADFSFTLDPQGLIVDTDAGAYENLEGADFTGDKGLYFPNYTDDAITGYSEFSDMMSIVNKGNIAITVTLSAELTGYGDVAVVADEGDFDGSAPAIYLAVDTGTLTEEGEFESADTVAAIATEGEDKFTVDVYDEESVAALEHSEEPEYKWTEEDGYFAEYPEADEITYSGLYFRLTGAIDTDADWTAVQTVAPSLKLVWAIDPPEDYVAPITYHTVSYDLNGEDGIAPEDQTVAEGEKTTAPTAPTAPEGKVFAGWYTEAECTTAFDFANTAIDADITLYAKWADAACSIEDATMTVGDTTVVTNVNLVGDAVDIGTVKFQLAGTTTWSNLSTSYRVFDADASTLTLKGTHVTSKLNTFKARLAAGLPKPTSVRAMNDIITYSPHLK